jgi:hypothetical protein
MTEIQTDETPKHSTIHDQILDRLAKIQHQIDRIERKASVKPPTEEKRSTIKDGFMLLFFIIGAGIYYYLKI